MTKQILFLNLVPTIGGAEVVLLELMIRLDADKFQPVLACREKGPLSEKCSQFGIKVIYINTLPKPGWTAWFTFGSMWINALRISSEIKKHNIALVHSNSVRGSYHGGLAARLAGVPMIIHVRDYLDSPFQARLKAYLLNYLSDRIVVVSHAVEKALLNWSRFLSGKVQVVYDGIAEIEAVKDALPSIPSGIPSVCEAKPIIAVIGNISRLKGQDIALIAFSKIATQYAGAHLVFIGEARDIEGKKYLSDLQNRVRELGLENRVIFAGFRNDVPELLKNIDVLVHPATLPDAFPHVLLEACAQGVLVVGSDIGGIGEIIQDGKTGRLVKPGDPDELADVLLDCMENPSRSEALKENGRVYVMSHFPMRRYVDSIQNIYRELLEK